MDRIRLPYGQHYENVTRPLEGHTVFQRLTERASPQKTRIPTRNTLLIVFDCSYSFSDEEIYVVCVWARV